MVIIRDVSKWYASGNKSCWLLSWSLIYGFGKHQTMQWEWNVSRYEWAACHIMKMIWWDWFDKVGVFFFGVVAVGFYSSIIELKVKGYVYATCKVCYETHAEKWKPWVHNKNYIAWVSWLKGDQRNQWPKGTNIRKFANCQLLNNFEKLAHLLLSIRTTYTWNTAKWWNHKKTFAKKTF